MPHDNWSNHYDKIYQLTYGGVYDKFTATTINEIAGILPGGTVFDFGAGTGRLSIPLAQRGYEVIAVEQSTGMVEVLQQKCADNGLVLPIHNCSIADYSNGSADLAVAVFTVLSYITDDDNMLKSLKNIADKLNPKGLFFLDLPDSIFFRNRVLFDINRPGFSRKVTISPTGEHQIFTYHENGSLHDHEINFDYEDEFPIRQWDWNTMNRLLNSCGLEDTGRFFNALVGTGSTYKLYRKL